MAAITVTEVSRDGSTVQAWSGVSPGGDTFANDGQTMVEFDNRSATTALTVSSDAPFNCDQGFDHNLSVVIAVTTARLIGPFPRSHYGETVSLTYANVVTGSHYLRAVRLPRTA